MWGVVTISKLRCFRSRVCFLSVFITEERNENKLPYTVVCSAS